MYICPTIGEDHEKDFLVTGTLDDFKIIVFSNINEYEKGFEYLELADYEPTEVSDELFMELAKNDDAFSGLILDIHSKNKIITKEELLI
jgi:hypothetical protein